MAGHGQGEPPAPGTDQGRGRANRAGRNQDRLAPVPQSLLYLRIRDRVDGRYRSDEGHPAARGGQALQRERQQKSSAVDRRPRRFRGDDEDFERAQETFTISSKDIFFWIPFLIGVKC
jgi:hypothetical protein